MHKVDTSEHEVQLYMNQLYFTNCIRINASMTYSTSKACKYHMKLIES